MVEVFGGGVATGDDGGKARRLMADVLIKIA